MTVSAEVVHWWWTSGLNGYCVSSRAVTLKDTRRRRASLCLCQQLLSIEDLGLFILLKPHPSHVWSKWISQNSKNLTPNSMAKTTGSYSCIVLGASGSNQGDRPQVVQIRSPGVGSVVYIRVMDRSPGLGSVFFWRLRLILASFQCLVAASTSWGVDIITSVFVGLWCCLLFWILSFLCSLTRTFVMGVGTHLDGQVLLPQQILTSTLASRKLPFSSQGMVIGFRDHITISLCCGYLAFVLTTYHTWNETTHTNQSFIIIWIYLISRKSSF